MMVSVLLRLKASGMLDEYPNLAAYVARGEARPAYKRAFAAQLAVFTGKPPTGFRLHPLDPPRTNVFCTKYPENIGGSRTKACTKSPGGMGRICVLSTHRFSN